TARWALATAGRPGKGAVAQRSRGPVAGRVAASGLHSVRPSPTCGSAMGPPGGGYLAPAPTVAATSLPLDVGAAEASRTSETPAGPVFLLVSFRGYARSPARGTGQLLHEGIDRRLRCVGRACEVVEEHGEDQRRVGRVRARHVAGQRDSPADVAGLREDPAVRRAGRKAFGERALAAGERQRLQPEHAVLAAPHRREQGGELAWLHQVQPAESRAVGELE